MGHVGERGDSGSFTRFDFEVIDHEADQHTIETKDEDLPEGFDWNDFFDYLDDLAEEYDVEYNNSYGEKE